MSTTKPTLWESERLTFERSLDLTIESLSTYGPLYCHWAIAYSGGKDSTAVVTLVASLIASGAIQAPESLTVLYADTRMELPPLQAAAMAVLETLQRRGIHTQTVLPLWMTAFLSTSSDVECHLRKICFAGVLRSSR